MNVGKWYGGLEPGPTRCAIADVIAIALAAPAAQFHLIEGLPADYNVLTLIIMFLGIAIAIWILQPTNGDFPPGEIDEWDTKCKSDWALSDASHKTAKKGQEAAQRNSARPDSLLGSVN